ncbi:MAG: hypothetical protein GX241_03100 [Ruminococcaceae bacterium]|nr:hypothetical protein [Oscillospiraceae bacterium]
MSIKDLAFSVYSFFFNLGAKKAVVENRVGLVSMHNAHFTDGLGEIKREMGKGYKYLKIERKIDFKFLTTDAYRLGQCKYIFFNDNFMPLSKCRPNSKTTIVQLWHGMGAFKKFGMDIPQDSKVRAREIAANKKLNFVVCSSPNVAEIYANAFSVDLSKIIDTGTPNQDFYFRKTHTHIYDTYPKLKNKFVILYAPTFRDGISNEEIFNNFDIEYIKSKLSSDVVLTVRMHPQVNNNAKFEEYKNATDYIDVTDYKNVNELCKAADLLITDYSSICMDFALQRKPMIFFAYDLDYYKGARDFYFDYEKYVPGPIVKTKEELVKTINEIYKKQKSGEETVDKIKLDKFYEFNFDSADGTATKQLLERILYN